VAEERGDMTLLSQALNTKSLLVSRLRIHERGALLREARRIAEEHDLTEPLVRALNNLAVVAETADRPAEADELLARGLDAARSRGHRAWLTQFGAALSASHYENADWDSAFAVAAETLEDGIQRTPTPIVAVFCVVKASFERGDDEGARAWLSRVPSDLAESKDVQNASHGATSQALYAFLSGDVGKGVDHLTRVWDMRAAREEWSQGCDALSFGADFAVLLGDTAATEPLAERYETVPESALTRLLRTDGDRLRAFRAIAAGREDVAADAFGDALAAARSLGRATYIAHVLADYGGWLVECGRADEAEPLLEEARRLFERMRATRWLERIDAVKPKESVAA